MKPSRHPATLTLDAMHAIARAHGGLCLSEQYVNCGTPLRWQCQQGHIWMASPDNVKIRWCVLCNRDERNRLALAELQAIAQARGGKCLSERYTVSSEKLLWQCAQGHTWKSAPSTIKSAGAWCPACANDNRRLDFATIHAMAASKGGRCLSTEYVSSNHMMRWQCANGHVWETTASHIRTGSWCMQCLHASMRASIDDMQALAKAQGGKCLSTVYERSSSKLQWQCAEGHTWFATPGHIHSGTWCPQCRHRSMPYTLQDVQALASKYGGQCLSRRYVNNSTLLRWQCEHGHIWKAQRGAVANGQWCPHCKREDREQEVLHKMQTIAKAKGGLCLSTRYTDHRQTLRWQCAEGHRWEARVDVIASGSWCRQCAAQRLKLTLEDMQEMARARGGQCLSEHYVDSNHRLLWQCKLGHTWMVRPSNIRQGSWCPECAWLAQCKHDEPRRKYLPAAAYKPDI